MMSDWREALLMMVLWALLLAVIAMLAGCTSTSLEQRTMAAKAIEGHYVDGIGCTRLRVADGKAAIAAAEENKAKQLEVKR